MEQIALGHTGITTSRIGLGTWAIGGWQWGGTDESQSIATIRTAVERGITLIDTAPVYGFGRSEELVGRALAEGGLRERVLIATKAGLSGREGALYRDSRPESLQRELEASLRRLRTDVIDLYQIHWPDPDTPLEQTARALEDMRRAGKIRAIGVSNFSPAQMDAFRALAPLASVQPPYNLFERDMERDVLPYARSHGLTVLCYGALCRGLLSGRMTAQTAFADDDVRSQDPKFRPGRFEQYVAAVEQLRALAHERYGTDVLALAVRWVLDQGPTVALWGARRPEQLDPLIDVLGWNLDVPTQRQIDELLRRCVREPIGPSFLAPPEHRPAGVPPAGPPVARSA